MAVKLLRYFLVFFVLIMIFLLTKNPYSLKYNSSTIKNPEIELFSVENYEILKSGISSILIAKKIERYRNYDKMFDISALHKGISNLVDSLQADKGLYKKGILFLNDNVKYTRSDELVLNTNSAIYDTTKKIISSNMPFEFIKKNVTTHGDSFVYDMQKGIIKATKIRTVIRTKSK